MKGVQILLSHVRGNKAAVLLRDGILDDLLIDSDAPRPGTVYRGKATRPVKGQGGMFFDTVDGSAYLRTAKGIAPGEFKLLQVSGYAEPGKAIPVTDRVLFKSRYAIATPDAPGINVSRTIKDEEARVSLRATAEVFADDLGTCGLILRSAAEHADLDLVEGDIRHVFEIAKAVEADTGTQIEKLIEGADAQEFTWREWPDVTPETVNEIDGYIEEARSKESPLNGAGHVYIENTRAFVAVDVNTGAHMTGAVGLKANIAAARALPRLLRIKGLGGQIVIDFAPMPKKDRRSVESALRSAFRACSVETTLIGWTQLGHFELTRKRARAVLEAL